MKYLTKSDIRNIFCVRFTSGSFGNYFNFISRSF